MGSRPKMKDDTAGDQPEAPVDNRDIELPQRVTWIANPKGRENLEPHGL